MNAIELLKSQHEEVKALFKKIESAMGSSQALGEKVRAISDRMRGRAQKGDSVADMVRELTSKLVAHSVIEKEIFYPAYARAIELDSDLFEAIEEHGVIEFELQKMHTTGANDPAFSARISVLKELIEHHVSEEESEVLKTAAKKIDKSELDSLGEKMLARFEAVLAGDYEQELVRGVKQALPPLRSARQGATVTSLASRRSAGKRASKPAGRSASAKRAGRSSRKSSSSVKGRSKSARSATPSASARGKRQAQGSKAPSSKPAGRGGAKKPMRRAA